MVLIGFSVCKEEVLNGAKQQTIRKPRKREWKPADILNLYWKIRTKQCEKLFDVPLESVERIQLEDITEEIAIADGFKSKDECVGWFNKTHKKYINSGFYEGFDLIKWNHKKQFRSCEAKKCNEQERNTFLRIMIKIRKLENGKQPNISFITALNMLMMEDSVIIVGISGEV